MGDHGIARLIVFFLRVGVVIAGFGVASLYAFLLTLVRRDRSSVPYSYGRALRALMQPPAGLRVDVEGEENLHAARPCVFVVNHQSAFDVPILAEVFPRNTVLIAKSELRKLPLFGWIYGETGNIYIDRADRQGAVQRLKEAEKAIAERKVSVWIFPEGTRGRVPGELLPFKKGAFHLAVSAQVPIVPIVVSPVVKLFDVPNRRFRPGTARIRVLPPFSTEGVDEAGVVNLVSEVHSAMSNALRAMS